MRAINTTFCSVLRAAGPCTANNTCHILIVVVVTPLVRVVQCVNALGGAPSSCHAILKQLSLTVRSFCTGPGHGVMAVTTCWVFSYGSNSATQLRARVKNSSLQCFPASVENFTRVFCLRSRNWSVNEVPSGAASLAPVEGACTYGCAAEMTEEEMKRLDVFEGADLSQPSRGVYRRSEVTMKVHQDGEVISKEGIVYIANDMAWQYPPSEQYLTAIHVMLREHWDASHHGSIAVRGLLVNNATESAVLSSLYDWQHPGNHSLSLPALCVEVNTLLDTPWVMPKAIKEIVHTLQTIGVYSAAHLAVYLISPDKRKELIAIFSKSGCDIKMTDQTLQLFQQVMEINAAN